MSEQRAFGRYGLTPVILPETTSVNSGSKFAVFLSAVGIFSAALLPQSMALTLLSQSESLLMILGIMLMVTGFFLGIVVFRGGTASLKRVPYFIWSAAVISLSSALSLAWLLSAQAIQSGLLMVLVSLIFGSVFVAGVAHGILAHARSVSIYGSGRGAWMAIVPFVNLALVFKRPMDWQKSGPRTLSLNILGILFGVLLLLIGLGLGSIAQKQTAYATSQAESDPALYEAHIDLLLNEQGLETTLAQMAAETPSQRLDEMTTLLRVEAEGNTLRYVYEVSTDMKELPVAVQTKLLEDNCGVVALRRLFEAGATVVHIYMLIDGTKIATITTSQRLCSL